MKIAYTASFQKRYRKLPHELRALVAEREQIFREDIFHPSLKTHKLHGRMRNFWAFSVNYEYRIVFRFTDGAIVVFNDIGNHSLYE